MTGVKETVYTPIPENVAVYEKLYDIYRLLHDAFGTADFHGSLHGVMKDLIQIRSRARRGE
jgi:L-ribulokinase